jgi:hypothetical protein
MMIERIGGRPILCGWAAWRTVPWDGMTHIVPSTLDGIMMADGHELSVMCPCNPSPCADDPYIVAHNSMGDN